MTDNIAPAGAPAGQTIANGTTAPPSPTPSYGLPAAPSTADAAREQLAGLRKDPTFMKAWAGGDISARQRVESLSKLSAPGEIEPGGDGKQHAGTGAADAPQQEAATTVQWPIATPPDADNAHVVATHTAISEIVKGMGAETEMARGMVSTIDRAITARNGASMNPAELDQLSDRLAARWGSGEQFQAKYLAAAKAMRASGKNIDYMKAQLLRAGPQVAALVLDSLASQGLRMK
jgi:hypothetical protein